MSENTGDIDQSVDNFSVEIFDGATGLLVGTNTLAVGYRKWFQIGGVLTQYAPGVQQGYARITRTSGNNSFIAYGVVNDGGQPGERTGDGAFVSSTP